MVQEGTWTYDFSLVTQAASVVLGFAVVVPILIWGILLHFNVPMKFVKLACLYGYSVVTFLPAAVGAQQLRASLALDPALVLCVEGARARWPWTLPWCFVLRARVLVLCWSGAVHHAVSSAGLAGCGHCHGSVLRPFGGQRVPCPERARCGQLQAPSSVPGGCVPSEEGGGNVPHV